MKPTKTTISVPQTVLNVCGYKPEDILFLTIETTGLSRQRSHLYLAGTVSFEDGEWIMRQWFCSKPSDEKEVLEDLSTLITSRRLLIHFNGKSFHVPYLSYRYRLYQMEPPFENKVQLDLYQKLLPYKNLLGLDHIRQTNLEERMDLHRSCTLSGEELLNKYKDFILTGDTGIKELLLLHNSENIEGLITLVPLLILPSLFTGQLSSFVHCSISAEGIAALKVFFTENFPVSISWKNDDFSIEISHDCATIYVPVIKDTLKFYFPDYKNYYYLPMEDEVIHKSLGIYVDADHREHAKAVNCYKKSKSNFLPQFSELFSPAFRKEYRSKKSWFSLKDHPLTDPESAGIYATHLLLNTDLSSKNKKNPDQDN